MRFIPMLCSMALVAPLMTGAQEALNTSWPLASGSKVRILSAVLGDKKVTGTVISATTDTIVFRQKSLEAARPLAVDQINEMDLAQGTHSRKLKGAAWGFVIGGLVTGGIAAATWEKPKNCFGCIDFGRGGDSAMAGLFGGILGGIVGTIVGSRHTDSWVPVRIR